MSLLFSRTMIRPGKKRLALHCSRSTVSLDRNPAAARSLVIIADRSLDRIFPGPSPPWGLSSYSRWVHLACLWFRRALAGARPLSAATIPWGVDLKAPRVDLSDAGLRVSVERRMNTQSNLNTKAFLGIWLLVEDVRC